MLQLIVNLLRHSCWQEVSLYNLLHKHKFTYTPATSHYH